MVVRCVVVLFLVRFSQAQCNYTEKVIKSSLFETIRLQSPGYDLGYQRDLMCRWIINFEDANSTAFIRAHFIGLVTKEDFVRVYAGTNDTSRVIVDGSVNPSADRTVVSTIQITEMLVVFVTDNQTGNDGVGFDIKIIESLDLSGSGCFQNEILEAKDTVQYLTSPKFPDLYKKNSNCAWTLVASPISEVTVYIVFVNLDFVGSTCYHYLRIVGFGDFCKTYESESTRETYNYSASSIQVKFHSDNVIAKIGSGFVIKYVKNNKPTEYTTPQETTTTAVHTPIEVTEMLTTPYFSTREYFTATVTTNKMSTEEQSELILTTEYMAERTITTEITTKKIPITDEIITEQMTTAEILTELTTTAHIKNPETTVITTKETTNGPITNEKTPTQTLFSTDNTTTEPQTTEFTTDQAEISTELTTTAEIKNAGKSTALTTKDTTNGLITNEKLGTPILVSTDNTTTEHKTTEFTSDQTTIATITITELITTAEISTVLTTTTEITNTGKTIPITTKETTNEKLATQTLVSTENTTTEPKTTDQTTTATITITEQMTTEEISTKRTTTSEIKNADKTFADITTQETTIEQRTNALPTLVLTASTITEPITEFTVNETTSKEATLPYTTTERFTTTDNTKIKTTTTTEYIPTEETTTEYIMSEQTSITAYKFSTTKLTTVEAPTLELTTEVATNKQTTTDHLPSRLTTTQLPVERITTDHASTAAETTTGDEGTMKISTTEQRTTGDIMKELSTTDQKITITTDLRTTSINPIDKNTINPTAAQHDELTRRTVSDAALVGIVIGGLVTMTIFGIIVGIAIYAFVLKRYYSSESYDKILHRSSSLSQSVPTVSPNNIIPKWISMWDASKMPGYNPTFQPLHEISPKVGTMPKWVKMMDSFEKSVHLQKVWKNDLEYLEK